MIKTDGVTTSYTVLHLTIRFLLSEPVGISDKWLLLFTPKQSSQA